MNDEQTSKLRAAGAEAEARRDSKRIGIIIGLGAGLALWLIAAGAVAVGRWLTQ